VLVEDIIDVLTSGGAGTGGTDLYAGPYPDMPIDVIGVIETGGLPGTYTMTTDPGLERPRLQIAVRSASYATARNRSQLCANLMDAMRARRINGVQYHWAQVVMPPAYLGQDENRNHLFVLNLDIVRDRSTTA
jgi:hypothetical protein